MKNQTLVLLLLTWCPAPQVHSASLQGPGDPPGGTVTVAPASDYASDLSAAEVLKRVEDKYASLSGYSGTGKSVFEAGDGPSTTGTFSIRLGRPSFYRIEWEQSTDMRSKNLGTFTNRSVIWSAGEGNYLMLVPGLGKYYKMPADEHAATPYSAIPEMFFHTEFFHTEGPLWSLKKPPNDLSKGRDERIGNIDCWVLIGKTDRDKVTVWVGKHDFLIRQIQQVREGPFPIQPVNLSDSAIEAMLKQANKPVTPEAVARMKKQMETSIMRVQQREKNNPRRIKTETHENISVNTTFTRQDFIPKVPAGLPLSETFP